LTLYR